MALMIPSLCEFCCHRKEVVSGKGSRFLLCQKSRVDHRFPKYPPQPIVQCGGFERNEGHHHGTSQGEADLEVPEDQS